jgi:hypothetical protein
MKIKSLLLVIPFTINVLNATEAQTITWDFSSGATPSSESPAFLTSATFSQGNTTTTGFITTSASSGYTGASGSSNATFRATTGAFSTSTSAYFDVTLDPISEGQISVSEISFGSRSTATGPTTLTLYSNLDNFATALDSASVTANSDGPWTLVTFSDLTIVSDINENLVLRIYASAGAGSTGNNNWRVDDLKVTAVPEPSTAAALAGLATLGLVAFRRRPRAA